MEKLTLEQMTEVRGGSAAACGGFEAGAAVYCSTIGLVCMAAGPVGWGAALLYGAAGMAIVAYCND